MRAFFALAAICVLIFAAEYDSKPEKKIGVIRHMNVTEEAFEKVFNRIQSIDMDFDDENYRHIFFNSMNEMTAALQSGQIDAFTTYEVVGKYLEAHNSNFECFPHDAKIADAFCCAMRENDTALKKEFNDAIDEIIADGTLGKLVKIYIMDANHNDQPEAIEMPKFPGNEYDEDYAPPIRIGVTGDLPPLDYVRPNGKPAGFNTAILAEISKRMKRNFVIVPIDGGARAIALTSKLVDVIFWVVVPTYDDFPIDIDKPKGIILTDPYFTDEIVYVRLKK
ncbi:MAG: transporter substrate-binding domain-containing protein [Selenomonadaceae bacterium]|nr:transporter substrate-binding domain-containing protein [Selenomonadaceae bacterium]